MVQHSTHRRMNERSRPSLPACEDECSCLCVAYASRQTTGVDVYVKPIKIPEQPVCVELFVLDAGGDDYTQELLKPHVRRMTHKHARPSIHPSIRVVVLLVCRVVWCQYATANAFVFVYDVTSLDSFHHLRSWHTPHEPLSTACLILIHVCLCCVSGTRGCRRRVRMPQS